jgi:subtilase family serine protease
MVSVDGTSASSPVFAGMLSLVNSQRVEAGKSTLGWVNPLLYKYYASFTNDITEGDKNACSGLEYSSVSGYYHTCCQEGFYPTTGWDPITGLGSINVEKFTALFGTLTFTPTAAPVTSPSKSLTTGAIVGIAVAAFAVLVFLIVVIVLLLRQQRSSRLPVSTGTVIPVSTIEAVD